MQFCRSCFYSRRVATERGCQLHLYCGTTDMGIAAAGHGHMSTAIASTEHFTCRSVQAVSASTGQVFPCLYWLWLLSSRLFVTATQAAAHVTYVVLSGIMPGLLPCRLLRSTACVVHRCRDCVSRLQHASALPSSMHTCLQLQHASAGRACVLLRQCPISMTPQKRLGVRRCHGGVGQPPVSACCRRCTGPMKGLKCYCIVT